MVCSYGAYVYSVCMVLMHCVHIYIVSAHMCRCVVNMHMVCSCGVCVCYVHMLCVCLCVCVCVCVKGAWQFWQEWVIGSARGHPSPSTFKAYGNRSVDIGDKFYELKNQYFFPWEEEWCFLNDYTTLQIRVAAACPPFVLHAFPICPLGSYLFLALESFHCYIVEVLNLLFVITGCHDMLRFPHTIIKIMIRSLS